MMIFCDDFYQRENVSEPVGKSEEILEAVELYDFRGSSRNPTGQLQPARALEHASHYLMPSPPSLPNLSPELCLPGVW